MVTLELAEEDEEDGEQVGEIEAHSREREHAEEGLGVADVDEGQQRRDERDEYQGVKRNSKCRVDLYIVIVSVFGSYMIRVQATPDLLAQYVHERRNWKKASHDHWRKPMSGGRWRHTSRRLRLWQRRGACRSEQSLLLLSQWPESRPL